MYKSNLLSIIPSHSHSKSLFSLWDSFPSWVLKDFSLNFSDEGFRDNLFELKDNKYLMELELPRFTRAEIKIYESDGLIHVSAERENKSFYKSFSAPADGNTKTLRAKLENGILTLGMDLIEPSESNRNYIEIE